MRFSNLSEDAITIAVIGGGSTGISFLSQFIREIQNYQSKRKFSLILFEPDSTLGTGLAYGTKSHSLLLNSPANCFSIYPENPKHFFEWLTKNESFWKRYFPEIEEINEDSFVPRKLAGLYLKSAAEEAKMLAAQCKIAYQIIQDEVINIAALTKKNKTRIQVKSSNIEYNADYVVLCTGNCPPESYLHLRKYHNYFHEIHLNEDKIVRSLPFLSSVLVVGTRLSGIDAVVLLKEQKYKGSITMASREGRLPAVKNEFKTYDLKYLTEEKIQEQYQKHCSLEVSDLIEFIEKEASAIYNCKISIDDIERYSYDDNLSTLKLDLKTIKQGKALWQKIPASFIEIIETYWSNFSIEEKKKYIKKYLHIMQRYTSAFPITNAEKLITLMENHNLIIKDKLINIEYDEVTKKFIAFFGTTNGGKEQKIFDAVLNATGNGKNLVHPGSLLYTNLLKSGKVNFNFFGGLEVSTKNFRVSTSDGSRIYAAGPPTFGSYFFTNFFYTSAKQSRAIIDDILMSSAPHYI